MFLFTLPAKLCFLYFKLGDILELRCALIGLSGYPLVRIFPNMQDETNTTKMFTQVFVELRSLKTVVIDKAELHLTVSQLSPGTIFVQSIIIKKCLHRVKV